MGCTIEELIKELSKYSKDAQVRVREYEEYSEVYYQLTVPVTEEEWENGIKYIVIF